MRRRSQPARSVWFKDEFADEVLAAGIDRLTNGVQFRVVCRLRKPRTLANFTRQWGDLLVGRRRENQWLGDFHGKRSVYLEGMFARMMYWSLHKMHQHALHGSTRVAVDTAVHAVTREPSRESSCTK